MRRHHSIFQFFKANEVLMALVVVVFGLNLSSLHVQAQPQANTQTPPQTIPQTSPQPNLPPNGSPTSGSTSDPAAGFNKNDPNAPAPAYSLSIFSGMMDPFEYDPRGRRDPFGVSLPDKPLAQGPAHGPVLPLQKFELNQLRLTAILWDVRSPKAILKDPTGVVYVITPNTKIGPRNGYVAAIREGEIVVVETIEQDGRLISSSQVVKIGK